MTERAHAPAASGVRGLGPRAGCAVLLLTLACAGAARASHIDVVSKMQAYLTAASGVSSPVAISADGNYVAFQSTATNLVSGQVDSNSVDDVFLWERATGAVTLVSHTSGSAITAASGTSVPVGISADGAYVVFRSDAADLVTGQSDSNGGNDAFVWQRSNGAVTLISHTTSATATANDMSAPIAISADGAWVIFYSLATNLISGETDGNGALDAFLWQRSNGALTLISHASDTPAVTGNGSSGPVAISSDGSWVAFSSMATNVVSGITDGNALADAFLWERATGITTLMSHSAGSTTTTANNGTGAVTMSADGAYVTLQSPATDLVSGQSDANNDDDVFLWSRAAGTATLISRIPSPATTAAGQRSSVPRISADGAYVAFQSDATDLVSGSDGNNVSDAFLWARASGAVTLISHANGAATTAANGQSQPSAISADGSYVAIFSAATDLLSGFVNADGSPLDAFLWTKATGVATLIAHAPGSPATTGNAGSYPYAVSADGYYVACSSAATDLVSGATDSNSGNDAFLWERGSGFNTLISHAPGSTMTTGSGQSNPAAISSDGAYVAFTSSAVNLIAGGTDANGSQDAFLWERLTGTITLISHATGSTTTAANGASFPVAISSDGSYVVFNSSADNLISGLTDINGSDDAFLWERTTGITTLISHAVGGPAIAANALSRAVLISADGSYVAFHGIATNLVPGQTDGNGGFDAFLWERATGNISLISHAANSPITTGNGGSRLVAMSADGAYVTFHSSAINLVPGQIDSNGAYDDAFLWSRATGAITLISHAAGDPATTADNQSVPVAISADGAYVTFSSYATNLVPGQIDDNLTYDAFLWSRTTGAITIVSRFAGDPTQTADFDSMPVAISADGSYVAFSSAAADLIYPMTDTNGFVEDVFLWERATGNISLISHAAGSTTTTGDGESFPAAMSADGAYVAFYSYATNLVPGQTDTNGKYDTFLWDRATGASMLASRTAASASTTGNGWSPSSDETPLSADGLHLAFSSIATDIAPAGTLDNNAAADVFVFSLDGNFYTLTPCRLVDTRGNGAPIQGPALSSGVARSLQLPGICSIPQDARALSLNLTAVGSTGAGTLAVFPGTGFGTQTPPVPATITFNAGQTRADNQVLRFAPDGVGTIEALATVAGGGTVHFVVDVNGCFVFQ